MNVTLRQLNVFSSVARNLSYTKAAEELHLSQPGVSMQVRQLEEHVGLPLFEKLGKQIHLTEAGQELYHYCQRIQRELDEAEEVIQALKGVQHGRLRISVATTVNTFAMRVVAAFTEKYPSISFSLDVTNRKTLLQQLKDNLTDLVIMGEPPDTTGLEAISFMANPLVVVAPPGHPLARRKKPIPLKEIADETFVIREKESGTREAMERFFRKNGIEFHAGMEMTSNEAIKQAVEAGLGLGIVSIHTIELELEAKRLKILNVAGFPIERYWYLVHLKEKRMSPVAEAFHKFVIDEANAIMPSPL